MTRAPTFKGLWLIHGQMIMAPFWNEAELPSFPIFEGQCAFYSSHGIHICQSILNLVQIQLYVVIYNWKRLSQCANKNIETLQFLRLNLHKHAFWFLYDSTRSNYAFILQIRLHFVRVYLFIFVVFAMWSSARVRDNKAMLSNRGSNS